MTGISVAQAKALGVSVPARREGTALPRPMNREEAAFAAWLLAERVKGIVTWSAFEPLKLRLANRTWYTPDFIYAELTPTEGICRVTVAEVKTMWRKKGGGPGRVGWREDSRVKWKCAAELYPCFRFVAAWREGGEWRFEVYGETPHHGDTETRRTHGA